MTDELYDYFGGNASKKVEPLDDDELGTVEDLVEEIATPTDGPEDEFNADIVIESEEVVVVQEYSSDEDLGVASSDDESDTGDADPIETEDENDDHWAELASSLGLTTDTPEKKPTPAKKPAAPRVQAVPARKAQPKSPKKSDTPRPDIPKSTFPDASAVFDEPVEAAESDEPELKGFADELFATEDTSGAEPSTLSKMFQPGQQKPELRFEETESESELAEPEDSAEPTDGDEDEEFLEFEIEDLDESPYEEGEVQKHGRRGGRRRSQRADSDAGSSRPRSAPTRRQTPASETTRDNRDAEESQADDREQEQEQANQPAAEDNARPPKRRSRRRGRGRNRDRDENETTAPTAAGKSEPKTQTKTQSFEDEIGWGFADDEVDDIDDSLPDSEDLESSSISTVKEHEEEVKEESGERSSRRRRRRRSPRRGERQDQAKAESDETEDLDEESLDDIADEFDDDDEKPVGYSNRPPRQRTPGREG